MALKKSSFTIPLAASEKLLKKAGAERVSNKAKKFFSNFLEELGIELGKKSTELSFHAGRKTVKEKDLIMASKQIKF